MMYRGKAKLNKGFIDFGKTFTELVAFMGGVFMLATLLITTIALVYILG